MSNLAMILAQHTQQQVVNNQHSDASMAGAGIIVVILLIAGLAIALIPVFIAKSKGADGGTLFGVFVVSWFFWPGGLIWALQMKKVAPARGGQLRARGGAGARKPMPGGTHR